MFHPPSRQTASAAKHSAAAADFLCRVSTFKLRSQFLRAAELGGDLLFRISVGEHRRQLLPSPSRPKSKLVNKPNSRPPVRRRAAVWLCEADLAADEFQVEQVSKLQSPAAGPRRGLQQDMRFIAGAAFVAVELLIEPDRPGRRQRLLHARMAENDRMIAGTFFLDLPCQNRGCMVSSNCKRGEIEAQKRRQYHVLSKVRKRTPGI